MTKMNSLAMLVLLISGSVSAQTLEALKAGSGARFAESSTPTEDLINGAVNDESRKITNKIGGGDALLKEVRKGENALLQKTIDESPRLRQSFEDARNNRTWRDVYQGRMVDAAVAYWGSNMKAGYIKGTAAAYATFETAPPVLNVILAAPLWVGGVIYGAALGLLSSALTGRF